MLEIEDLKVHFPIGRDSAVRAVDGISLSLGAGERVGLVGESGSGKSTVGKAALRLLSPTSGRIKIAGVDITKAQGKALRHVRRKAQMIFQDPHSSLNPRMTIFRSVAEPLILHTRIRGRALNGQVAALLERVGLPGQFLHRFPHELSGGQKQRVCIARALALDPTLLVLDEPTSALDVSVQAQILEFLKELHGQRPDMTSLFISHDLAVVRFLCSRVAVMYLGRIVEEGTTEQVFAAPQHPYTRALLSAVPLPQGRQSGNRIRLTGDIPSPANPPSGCPFHPRCPEAIAGVCDVMEPVFEQSGAGTSVRCHLLTRNAA
ncbi:MAG: ABC transporter ATP-binding protein [Alphaproteobacteria bacterium]|nr:ABC transporter ATP-binding protein [Alphaproteobacteria bacterium]